MTQFYLNNYSNKGNRVIRLEPEPGTSLLGRAGGFLIHGNNDANNASQGCIIIGGAANRKAIWDNGDRLIEVADYE